MRLPGILPPTLGFPIAVGSGEPRSSRSLALLWMLISAVSVLRLMLLALPFYKREK